LRCIKTESIEASDGPGKGKMVEAVLGKDNIITAEHLKKSGTEPVKGGRHLFRTILQAEKECKSARKRKIKS